MGNIHVYNGQILVNASGQIVAADADCCCQAAPCGECSGTTPANQIVTFGGVTVGVSDVECDSVPDNCPNWNAAHTLPQCPINACFWSGKSSAAVTEICCTGEAIVGSLPCIGEVCVVLSPAGADTDVSATVRENGIVAAVFEKTITGNPIDCSAIGDMGPPTVVGNIISGLCDWSNATCSISGA